PADVTGTVAAARVDTRRPEGGRPQSPAQTQGGVGADAGRRARRRDDGSVSRAAVDPGIAGSPRCGEAAEAARQAYPCQGTRLVELLRTGRQHLRGPGSHPRFARLRQGLLSRLTPPRSLDMVDQKAIWGVLRDVNALFCAPCHSITRPHERVNMRRFSKAEGG